MPRVTFGRWTIRARRPRPGDSGWWLRCGRPVRCGWWGNPHLERERCRIGWRAWLGLPERFDRLGLVVEVERVTDDEGFARWLRPSVPDPTARPDVLPAGVTRGELRRSGGHRRPRP